jgi:hypothetical protein
VFSEERNASVMRAFDDRSMHELVWLVDWAAKSDVEEEDEELQSIADTVRVTVTAELVM